MLGLYTQMRYNYHQLTKGLKSWQNIFYYHQKQEHFQLLK